MLYHFLKFIEHLQIIYYLMRAVQQTHWNYSFLTFFNVLIKHLTLDRFFSHDQQIFASIFISFFVVTVLVTATAICIGFKAGWGKDNSGLVKVFTPFLSVILFMIKTILFIPMANLLCIANVPSVAHSVNVELTPVIQALGAILAVLVVGIMGYILIFLRETNPFSQIPNAGETFFKGLLWQTFKLSMVVNSLLDYKGNHERQSTVVFSIVLIFLVCYSHYEIGLFKASYKAI